MSDAWVRTVLDGDACYDGIFANVSREQLLALDRRKLLGLKLSMPHANKIAFAIEKLRSTVDDDQVKKREAAVNEKIASASVAAAAAAAAPSAEKKSKTEDVVISPSTSAVVGAAPRQDAEEWDVQTVHRFLLNVDADAAERALTLGLNGAQLLEMTSRDVSEKLGVQGMIQKRKVEHAIAKLKEPIVQRRADEEERSARTLSGTFPLSRSTEQKQLRGSVFVYVTQDAQSGAITFEADNTTNPPAPVVLSVSIEGRAGHVDAEHKFFLVPNAQVRVEGPSGASGGSAIMNKMLSNAAGAGGRRQVLLVQPSHPGEAFRFSITHSPCTMDDWVALDNAQKEAMVQAFAPLPSTASVVEIEVAMDGRAQKFVDAQFPPTLSSLYLDPANVPAQVKIPVQWKRPEDFTEGPVVLYNEIDPNLVAQGRLGDCWFLASLSIISRYPALVLNLFETRLTQRYGVYACRFMRGGKWRRVVVDDFLPCTPTTGWIGFDLASLMHMQQYLAGTGSHASGGPVYSRSKDGSLWVSILEKAYAKLNRSYQALTSGTLGESLYDMTGAPCVNYFLPWLDDVETGLFGRMLELHDSGQLMGCSTRMLKEKERQSGFQLEKFGIVSRHAYSIIDVKRVQKLEFIRLRNPWGQFVWNGDYSDSSDKWTVSLKQALNYKVEPGQFWMLWSDFIKFFCEITVCKVGALSGWSTTEYDGVYSNDQQYGPQCTLRVVGTEPTPVLVSIAKEDLRFAVGADKDNSQGIYLIERLADNSCVLVEASSDSSRREVSIEATLLPGRTYQIACLSFMGNLKFSRIPYHFSVHAQHPVEIVMAETFDAPLLCEALLADMRAHANKRKRFTSEVYTLIHLCFMSTRAGVSNRLLVGEEGARLLLDALKRYSAKENTVSVCCSAIWNLACSVELRPWFRQSEAIPLLKEVEKRWWQLEEMREAVDAAIRNIQNDKAIAMDPFIEDCILQNACTFSVTGDKSFLLQIWYDCVTCNLRSNYGVCQTCASVCHAGHELSPPKFSRFFCDCGGQPKEKRPASLPPCKCVKEGMTKKREQDRHFYNPDEEDNLPDPSDKKPVKPRAKGGIATLFDK